MPSLIGTKHPCGSVAWADLEHRKPRLRQADSTQDGLCLQLSFALYMFDLSFTVIFC